MKKLIVSFILFIAFIFTFSIIDLKAATVPGYSRSDLTGVTVNYTGRSLDELWTLFDDGYWYYDIDGSTSLQNGLLALNTDIVISSTNINYHTFEFLDETTDLILSFDIQTYVTFYITYQSVSDTFTIKVVDEDYPKYTAMTFTYIYNAVLRVKDDYWYERNKDITSYNQGYENGYITGGRDEYINGYENGLYDMFIDGSGQHGFNESQSQDFIYALEEAHENGFEGFSGFNQSNDTSYTYQQGYAIGYQDNSPISFLGLIAASGLILNVIFTTEIFKGITIGMFILIPLLFAILGLFLRLRKGG